MKLRELLVKINTIVQIPQHPALELEVQGIQTNSRECGPGDLFIGMPGTRVDGGEFWQSAMAKGAIAALITPSSAAKCPPDCEATALGVPDNCVILTPDPIATCAAVAGAFFNYPAQQLKLIGVTGTNGKTTTTHLIEFFLTNAQLPTALLGTLYTRWPGFAQTALHTTPFAGPLQEQLAAALKAGSEFAVMEVSSHALVQRRVLGCPFEVGVFTNLTQDHLDYHQNMEDYFAAKALLFSPEYLKTRAIINQDDPYGKRLLENFSRDKVWSYSINDSEADLWTSNLTYEPNKISGILHSPTGEAYFSSPLVGQFNLANLLAAVGTVLHLGLDLEAVLTNLPNFLGVPGRMERVQISPKQDISVIVDYAHTPDSLECMLRASRPFIQGNMICVFGCGGDRDRTKRPLMGKIAAELADIVVVTSDNPRTEDRSKILEDIVAGIPTNYKPIVIGDRAKAIETAIRSAKPGDGVLIAGKGHEDYQILGTEKIHFDDREQARNAIAAR